MLLQAFDVQRAIETFVLTSTLGIVGTAANRCPPPNSMSFVDATPAKTALNSTTCKQNSTPAIGQVCASAWRNS